MTHLTIQANRILLALAVVVALTACACNLALAADDKQQMTAAVDAVRPALVRIHVVSADYQQGRAMKVESYGSGVIISPEGYAITNHHVAGEAEHIVCTLADRREVEAKLIGTDPMADIAVIKLISTDSKPFPFAEFGDSSKLEVGDRVFAMGCPYALSQSVTAGMVSNAEMVMPGGSLQDEFTLEGEDVGSIVRWIGHDALIRPGNSGGPLVDPAGKIVGINEISYGLSGAIPSNLAKEVADKLTKDGKVIRSWLGIEVQPLLESSKLEKGILISGVLADSPGKKAGFKSGDVLVTLAGHEVTAHFREEIPLFNQFVADLPVGQAVEAKIVREGKETTLTVTPDERQKAYDKQQELKNWGLCASNITYLMRKEMEIESAGGIYAESVLPSGPAGSAKPALRDGDVITKVDGKPVNSIADFKAITRSATEGHEDAVPVLVDFERKRKNYATVVKVGKKEQSRSGAEISKAWLPIDLQVLTRELAEGLGIKGKTGVRVTQVYPDSTAAKAGLKVGDLILKLDDEEIPVEQEGDEEVLPSLIRQYDIGAQVKLGVIRAGKPTNIEVELQASPKLARDYPKYENDDFEFTTRDIAFSDRADAAVDRNQTGVFVESVADGSWASLGGLQTGDTIAEIDGAPIAGLADLKKKMGEISQAKPKTVVLKIVRGIHTQFLEIEPKWPES